MRTIVSDRHEFRFDYQINEKGEIYSPASNRWIKPFYDRNKYLRVSLQDTNKVRKSIPLHRLVLNTFKPCENSINLTVNHIDGNKENNNLSNLEWMTNKDNIKHAFNNNLRNEQGENNYFHKLKESDVLQIVDLLLFTQYTYNEIATWWDVNEETIARIKRKISWKHLTTTIVFPKRSTTSRRA